MGKGKKKSEADEAPEPKHSTRVHFAGYVDMAVPAESGVRALKQMMGDVHLTYVGLGE